MATSGSVDFALTAREIITQAFQLAKIYSSNESIASEDADTAEIALNLMLKTWGSKERLWIRTEGSQALTASTASYAITGARRMVSVRRRTSSIDTPMNELSRQEYYDLPNKSATGMPVSWYFDPQRAVRTLYVWLAPSTAVAANTTLEYTYLRVIEDIDDLANDVDLPQEWLEALVYNLAAKLGGMFGTDTVWLGALRNDAKELLKDLSSQDQEDASIYFEPGR